MPSIHVIDMSQEGDITDASSHNIHSTTTTDIASLSQNEVFSENIIRLHHISDNYMLLTDYER